MIYETEQLYYQNNKLFDFEATVLECVPAEDGFSVILDRTAFFPEGGGQAADEGHLDDAVVKDVQITDKGIVHFTDAPLEKGKKVKGKLDESLRIRRMRNHSGEHILSSVVNRKFGYDNVGFHMSEHSMDVDFNGDFTKEQLKEIELEANEIIRKNVPVKCYYPTKEELEKIKYRSKLELDAPRIVEIEGYDFCACCAPHVSFTGEIGYLIITESHRNRTNTRLTLLCGEDACEYVKELFLSAYKAGSILSAKPVLVGDAVEKMNENNEGLRRENQNLKRELSRLQIESLKPTDGFLTIFTDKSSVKDVVNKGVTIAKAGVCVFSGEEGAYSYMIASNGEDIRPLANALNEKFNGKGGGKPEAVQGRVNGNKEDIVKFIEEYARS